MTILFPWGGIYSVSTRESILYKPQSYIYAGNPIRLHRSFQQVSCALGPLWGIEGRATLLLICVACKVRACAEYTIEAIEPKLPKTPKDPNFSDCSPGDIVLSQIAA